ncbi:MAG: muramoyltetrapeptide [Planctomycetota bacterium]|nr:MAG: muramoyltetrapeptide [Planctomycetota bacterium]
MKPPRLRPGDLIAVVCPSSAPSMPALRRGVREIEKRGYRVLLGKHVAEKCDHLAGRDIDRLTDLNEAFRNPAIKAIFCARGGAGATRLLDRLDYAAIRRFPKIFVGYSDLTAPQLAIFHKTGLVTFSGPMVATDFDGGLRPFTARHFWPLVELPAPPQFCFKKPLEFLGDRPAQGPLLGGTLSVLQTILGTPYAPSFDGALLVLEDIGEKVHRVDRMLAQLRLAGVWDRIAGAVFATWTDCKPRPALERTLRHYAKLLKGRPAVFGVPYGHVDDKVTLPMGVMARVDPVKREIAMLEGAVE